jgi:hypothetical protein
MTASAAAPMFLVNLARNRAHVPRSFLPWLASIANDSLSMFIDARRCP